MPYQPKNFTAQLDNRIYGNLTIENRPVEWFNETAERVVLKERIFTGVTNITWVAPTETNRLERTSSTVALEIHLPEPSTVYQDVSVMHYGPYGGEYDYWHPYLKIKVPKDQFMVVYALQGVNVERIPTPYGYAVKIVKNDTVDYVHLSKVGDMGYAGITTDAIFGLTRTKSSALKYALLRNVSTYFFGGTKYLSSASPLNTLLLEISGPNRTLKLETDRPTKINVYVWPGASYNVKVNGYYTQFSQSGSYISFYVPRGKSTVEIITGNRTLVPSVSLKIIPRLWRADMMMNSSIPANMTLIIKSGGRVIKISDPHMISKRKFSVANLTRNTTYTVDAVVCTESSCITFSKTFTTKDRIKVKLRHNLTDRHGKPRIYRIKFFYRNTELNETTGPGELEFQVPGRTDMILELGNKKIIFENLTLDFNYTLEALVEEPEIVFPNEIYLSSLASNLSVSEAEKVRIVFNLSTDLKGKKLVLRKCESWDFTTFSCKSDWKSVNFEVSNSTVVAEVPGFSAYVLTEEKPQTIVPTPSPSYGAASSQPETPQETTPERNETERRVEKQENATESLPVEKVNRTQPETPETKPATGTTVLFLGVVSVLSISCLLIYWKRRMLSLRLKLLRLRMKYGHHEELDEIEEYIRDGLYSFAEYKIEEFEKKMSE
ncbi:MAG: hypothetical protein GXO63_02480 [Candidatus Micrarchaeota archaeon]|nr:hypothetical protein [Candidatus Micrarchaeota archaeon]